MKIKTISLVLGTRPQIIKSQSLLNQLKKVGFKINVIHTGQHYDYELSRKFFSDLSIVKPSVNLGVGKGTSIQQMAKIILRLENYFKKNLPDLVIVPGDTTSALAAAVAASKCKLKLAHLEAGARSNQFYMEEEINRRLIDHCSDFLFAPTKNCFTNLKNESVFGKSFFVGDTMYDLFLEFNKKYNFKSIKSQKEVLVTIHRAESIKNKLNLQKICSFINKIHLNGFSINFPIHPHTKKMIKKFGINLKIKPRNSLGYIDLMKNLAKSTFVITDSGGLQKEAYWMGKPCITIRESTEWIETVKEGGNFIFPLSKPFNINSIERISSKKIRPKRSLYGNGNASVKIANIIKKL